MGVVAGVLLAALASVQAPLADSIVVRCRVIDDPESRVYELRRSGEGQGERWTLAMRGRTAGASAVLLPLPDAKPTVTDTRVTLAYQTLNGGRDVELSVTPSRATLDVHANFELEVNIEADLDPRVELMNTEGPISNLVCNR